MQRELFSVNAFCEAHSISRATFYRLLASGEGPKVVSIRGRIMVTSEAAAEWRTCLTERTDRTAAQVQR